MKNTTQQDNELRITLRIMTRTALGMTAEEFNTHEKQLAENLKNAQRRAINDAIKAGLSGDGAKIDEAVEHCRTLGCLLPQN